MTKNLLAAIAIASRQYPVTLGARTHRAPGTGLAYKTASALNGMRNTKTKEALHG